MNSGPVPAPKSGISADEIYTNISASGKEFVLLNFYASWCKPCRREFPDLVALKKDAASSVDVMFISIDKNAEVENSLPGFLGEFGVDFQTYAKPVGYAGLIKEFYPAWDGNIPLSLLYNKEGKQLEVFKGMTDREEIELVVNRYQKMGS